MCLQQFRRLSVWAGGDAAKVGRYIGGVGAFVVAFGE